MKQFTLYTLKRSLIFKNNVQLYNFYAYHCFRMGFIGDEMEFEIDAVYFDRSAINL